MTDLKGASTLSPSAIRSPWSALLLPFIHITCTDTFCRFQTFMCSSIASSMSSLQRRACSVSSTLTPRDDSLRFTRKPWEAPARNVPVIGSVVGSGRYGSTLTTCPCPLIDATTSSTSLVQYVQHARFTHASFSHVYR